MNDKASFRTEDIQAVWIRPLCVFTLSRECDGHHILGRGYDAGYGKAKDGRKIFSSILNFIPICRTIHHGPLRDTKECRLLFLRLAEEKVSEAIRRGDYELTEIDVEYESFKNKWREKWTD